MKRGVLSIEALRERCVVDPGTHCWIWQGCKTTKGQQPRLHTLDYAAGEKRVMSGPLAAWNIAYGAAPRVGCLVFRACQHSLCLNPAHLREARNKAEIGLHIRRAGTRRGTATEARRANAAKAHAARGIVPTSPEIVKAIRAADPKTSNKALALQHGLVHTTVSKIRRGESHKHLLAAPVAPVAPVALQVMGGAA